VTLLPSFDFFLYLYGMQLDLFTYVVTEAFVSTCIRDQLIMHVIYAFLQEHSVTRLLNIK